MITLHRAPVVVVLALAALTTTIDAAHFLVLAEYPSAATTGIIAALTTVAAVRVATLSPRTPGWTDSYQIHPHGSSGVSLRCLTCSDHIIGFMNLGLLSRLYTQARNHTETRHPDRLNDRGAAESAAA